MRAFIGKILIFLGAINKIKIDGIEYIGIASDEPSRFGTFKNPNKISPLVELDWEEDLCGLWCKYSDLLSPDYDTGCRGGCWFCHNQGVDQLRNLRKNYPEHWKLLLKWDKDSPTTFRADGTTVHDFDKRFELEDLGLVPDDNKFRWNMLNAECLQTRILI